MKKHRQVPSFIGLAPASALSSRIKKANISRNTRHEIALQKELSKLALRFQTNVLELPGRPDIVFSKWRVAVFCDGDFWHGRRWRVLKRKLAKGTNAGYWCAKIASNRRRDKRTTRLLTNSGWHVVRIWESDIKKDVLAVAVGLEKTVRSMPECKI